VGRVAIAMAWHELMERVRDRWVIVVTALFALLSVGVTVYGGTAGEAAGVVTGPSLVTLCTFLVPLVALVLGHDAIVGERERHTLGLLLSLPVSRAEVLFAKFIGRAMALCLAIGVGLGSAAIFLGPGQRHLVLTLLPTTLLLGVSFLSIGMLISVVTRRNATAASLAVVVWFLLVFFYDLGLLAAMVGSDGALPQATVGWLVSLNPAGLYRTSLFVDLMGQTALEDLGLIVSLPGQGVRALIWGAWILLPLGIGTLLLNRPTAVTS
jgi:Cu-processing system permease protein